MVLYRIASRRYAPNNSEGARLYGGRWNRPGTAAIYTSSTRSLAVLEVIVHNGAIPADYRVVLVEVPESVAIEFVEMQQLARSWPSGSSYLETADLGTEWAHSLRTAVLRVPSAVIPAEFNYILNPEHPDFSGIRFWVPEYEYIDDRLQG